MRGVGACCLSQADPQTVPWELGQLVRAQCGTLDCQLFPKVGQRVLSILVTVFVLGCSWKQSV